MPDYDIKYVPHGAIDKMAWNKCVDNSFNGLIYGRTEYLDAITPQWDGLIYRDYEAVMPLPVKVKFGLKYIYQPWGLAQGGVFRQGKKDVLFEEAFIKKLFEQVKYGTLDLNESSLLAQINTTKLSNRNNYVLNLQQAYDVIENAYHPDAKKNLRRSARFDQSFVEDISPSTVMKFYKEQYGTKNKVRPEDYQRVENLMTVLMSNSFGFCCGVQEGGRDLAAAFFGKYKGRLYYLLGAPTEEGRNQKSMYLLLDAVIKKFAQKMETLDFEGSDIPSVAAFYQKFGPENRPYPSLHFNHLPLPLKWLKK